MCNSDRQPYLLSWAAVAYAALQVLRWSILQLAARIKSSQGTSACCYAETAGIKAEVDYRGYKKKLGIYDESFANITYFDRCLFFLSTL